MTVVLVLAACTGSEIQSSDNPANKAIGRAKTDDTKAKDADAKAKGKRDTVVVDDQAVNSEEDPGTAVKVSKDASAPISYPELTFKVLQGSVNCPPRQMGTYAEMTTKVSDETIEINLTNAHLDYDGKGADEANQKIQSSIGRAIYKRPTKKDRAKLVESGFDFAEFAIFAKSVVKERQGQTITFDPPLPIFPWPASAAAFEKLEKQGKRSWSSTINHVGRSFPVTMTVEKVGGSGDEVLLRFQLTIPSDTDYSLYDQLPIPRQSTYKVNRKYEDVRSVETLNLFADENCGPFEKGELTQTYALCTKVRDGKTKQYCKSGP